jgi:hypothetical protein
LDTWLDARRDRLAWSHMAPAWSTKQLQLVKRVTKKNDVHTTNAKMYRVVLQNEETLIAPAEVVDAQADKGKEDYSLKAYPNEHLGRTTKNSGVQIFWIYKIHNCGI